MERLGELYNSKLTPLKELKFVPATKDDKVPIPEGINLIVLNGGNSKMPRTAKNLNKAEASTSGRVLFDASTLKFEWDPSRHKRPGAGLRNLGNTCFLNSVLQCLTHTPALAEHLLHSKLYGAGRSGVSPLRGTQEHVRRAFAAKCLSPQFHIKTMKLINKSFRPGRQEDAHEYFIALIDAMHENLLEGLKPKPTPSVQATSMIYSIFAGRMRSQVKCSECGYESNTIDPFLDISLEINRAQTLEKALERFTANEYLDGGNKYKCPRHSSLVRAVKRMAIEKAPNILCIHFKRFEFSIYGQKINKKVDFGTVLNLAPFMTDRRSPPVLYELYAVLVHQGFSVHSGHYFAFVKAPNGTWYQMNDEQVSQVSERVLLSQKAYILFYQRKQVGGSSRAQSAPPAQQTAKPKGADRSQDLANGHASKRPRTHGPADAASSPTKKAKQSQAQTPEKQSSLERKRPREAEPADAPAEVPRVQLPQQHPNGTPSDLEKDQSGQRLETKPLADIKNSNHTRNAVASNQISRETRQSAPEDRGGTANTLMAAPVESLHRAAPKPLPRRTSAFAPPASFSPQRFQSKSWRKYSIQSNLRRKSSALNGCSPKSTPSSTPPLNHTDTQNGTLQPLPKGGPPANKKARAQDSQQAVQETIDRSTKPVRRKPSILGEKSRATNERKLVSELVGNGETGNAPVANGRIATDHGRAAETGAKISAGAKLAANAQSHDASQSTATAIRTTTDRQIVNQVLGCDPSGVGGWNVEPNCGMPELEPPSRLPGRKARHQLDEYDQEYDKGMTKKRKGITNVSWQSSTGSLKPKQFERRRPQKQP